MRKTRKIRVTRIDIEEIKAAKRKKANKKKIIPGPWTNLEHKSPVKAKLRATNGMLGDMYGSYTSSELWTEKGWYPIVFNVTSKSIMKDVEELGIDEYLAACEESLNTVDNKKRYGTLVFLTIAIDGSQRDERSRRFISIHGKTNKKSIKGFAATRKKVYKIL